MLCLCYDKVLCLCYDKVLCLCYDKVLCLCYDKVLCLCYDKLLCLCYTDRVCAPVQDDPTAVVDKSARDSRAVSTACHDDLKSHESIILKRRTRILYGYIANVYAGG